MKPLDRKAAEYRERAQAAYKNAEAARTNEQRQKALVAARTYEALAVLEDQR